MIQIFICLLHLLPPYFVRFNVNYPSEVAGSWSLGMTNRRTFKENEISLGRFKLNLLDNLDKK